VGHGDQQCPDRTNAEIPIEINKKYNWNRIWSYDHVATNPVNEPKYILLSDYKSTLSTYNIKNTKCTQKGVCNTEAVCG
jgi:hypothetical protein